MEGKFIYSNSPTLSRI